MIMKPCYICRSTKKYSPLGFIEKTCFKCNGVGYLDDAEVDSYQLAQLEHAPQLMPLLNDFPLALDNENEQIIKPKKSKKKPRSKPVLNVDHPLLKLKDKIASVNT